MAQHSDSASHSVSKGSKVRVRFAPSPTGQLHVGNARTALVNWLVARQKGGSMVLRIEDTDLERSEARFEKQIYEDLRWLGIDWDEGPDIGGSYGPYRQSDRLKLYHGYAERLVAEQKAYFCFCQGTDTEKDADADEGEEDEPDAQEHHHPGPRIDECRTIPPAEAAARRAAGSPAAIRLRIPERPIRFHDIVRGKIEFSHEAVSDFVLMRSSGVPVYNYVVVVDDAEMKITHVIRGDDHLANTPKQVALYEALGWPVPEFAHLSTILGPDRERLSKRHGATSLAQFLQMGVLPQALMNYLALLGWAPSGGTRETFTAPELIREFSLKRVTPSPAVFDMEKLNWLNRHYIKSLSADALLEAASPFFIRAGYLPEGPSDELKQWFKRVLELLAPYVDRFEQLPEKARLLFHLDAKAAVSNPDNAEVVAAPNTPAVWREFARLVCAESGEITAERFKAMVNEVKTATGAKGKDLFHPIRMMITGSHSGPDFDRLVPILEQGSKLPLPVRVPSVRERVKAFQPLIPGGA